MTYQNVDIPFFTGQDESFDRKVLPVGPMRRVENSFQERTGRMVQKFGYEARPDTFYDKDGLPFTTNEWDFQCSVRGDKVIGVRRGSSDVFSYTPNRLNKLDGQFAGFGYLGNYTVNAVGSTKTSETWSPSIAVTKNAIVFAFVSGPKFGEYGANWVNIVIYDRFSRRILRTYETEASENDAVGVKVVGNRKNDQYAIIVMNRTGDTTGGLLQIYSCESLTSAPELKEGFSTYPTSSFDAEQSPFKDGDVFCVAFVDDTGELRVQLRAFDGLSLITEGTSSPALSAGAIVTVGCALYSATAAAGCCYTGTGYSGFVHHNWRQSGYVTNGFSFTNIGNESDEGSAPCMAFTTESEDLDRTSVEVAVSRGREASTVYLVNLGGAVSGETIVPGGLPIGGGFHGYDFQFLGYFPFVSSPDLYQPGVYNENRFSSALSNTTIAKGHVEGESFGSGTIVRAGAGDYDRWSASATSFHGSHIWTPAHPVRSFSTVDEENDQWYYPHELVRNEEADTRVEEGDRVYSANYSVLTHRGNLAELDSLRYDRGETLICGAGLMVADDQAINPAGFSGPPVIRADDVTQQEDFFVTAIMEWRDSSGRLWQSAPAIQQFARLSASEDITIWPCVSSPKGSRVVIYMTEAGDNPGEAGSVFYKVDARYVGPEGYTFHGLTYTVDPQAETLYTAGGAILSNDPPPACRYITRTRSRIWVGLLDFPARVQATKFLRPTEGVHWSNFDTFFVDVPEDVTGLAAMDDSVLIFSEDSIFLTGGQGPDDRGVGVFREPAKIPSDVGCINYRSIVTTGPGVFFQSRRGIELINRGFSAPQPIGDAVRDTTEEYPVCLGVEEFQEWKQVRWLFADSLTSPSKTVVIVYDQGSRAWSVWPTKDVSLGMGLVPFFPETQSTADYPSSGMSLFQEKLSGAVRETVQRDNEIVQKWTTGDIRPTGINGNALGRRVHILGTYVGPCTVTVRMAYNDRKDWNPKWFKTWELTSERYEEGDPVELEILLPVQKFMSVRFGVESKMSTADTVQGFKAHGISVYFDTEGEGQRVGRGSKG